ncbi:UNVERIFIED_CONTAM: hypothetical protein Sradi_2033700 [Sesamum radiatum]|uniref:MULE transposase domain-containing protein n=1 Tax=Sesamum radiatum TaxID=300843 RepID=A0AAW2TH17_SESRA
MQPHQNYTGPSNNAGPSSYVGQSNYAGPSSNAGTSTYNEEDDDSEGDSLLNNERSDSELDEVEEEDQMPASHENDDEVSIDIMMDVLGTNADVPTTPTIKDKFGFEIPYHKAWQALKAARERIYGTWESSVQKLPKYMAALQKWNSGTVVEWYHLDTDRPGLHMFNYVFWVFRPCIQGFRHCRNAISVDRTHLYTRYKHKLLVAVTLDANNQVLPLAFALVNEETLASWTWFLQMLAKHFLPGEED